MRRLRISGLIVQHAGWRWVFLSVPLLAIPAGLMLWPAVRGRIWSNTTTTDSNAVLGWATGAATGVLGVYLGGQLHGMLAPVAMAPALLLTVYCACHLLPAVSLRRRAACPA